jgi:hypothetical protein
MAAPTVTSESYKVYHARVGRRELDRLFLVAGEGAPAGSETFRTRVNSTTIEGSTLAELVTRRDAQPYVSSQTPWSFVEYKRDEGPDRSIRIRLSADCIEVDTTSIDPIWAFGQLHRLLEVLSTAHGHTRKVTFWRGVGVQLATASLVLFIMFSFI